MPVRTPTPRDHIDFHGVPARRLVSPTSYVSVTPYGREAFGTILKAPVEASKRARDASFVSAPWKCRGLGINASWPARTSRFGIGKPTSVAMSHEPVNADPPNVLVSDGLPSPCTRRVAGRFARTLS